MYVKDCNLVRVPIERQWYSAYTWVCRQTTHFIYHKVSGITSHSVKQGLTCGSINCNHTERLLTTHRLWVLHKKQVVKWVMPQDVLIGKMWWILVLSTTNNNYYTLIQLQECIVYIDQGSQPCMIHKLRIATLWEYQVRLFEDCSDYKLVNLLSSKLLAQTACSNQL